METQNWRFAAVAWRAPSLADSVLASVTWYVLHTAPDVHEALAFAAAFIVLRCVRFHRQTRTRQ
ncbi:hypothetical protein ACF05F_34970 [Rhodococcus erythropolis]|jgi:hypothetical protein